MQQGFGIEGFDGSIIVVAGNRNFLEKLMEDDPLLNAGTNIVELEINDEPLSEKGKETLEKIRQVWEEKRIKQLRFDKGRKWYAMSADERADLVYNLLTIRYEDLVPVDLD